MSEKTVWSSIFAAWLIIFFPFFSGESTGATQTIRPLTNIAEELIGYDSLKGFSLIKVDGKPRESETLELPYNDLAVLNFSEGPSNRVLLGDESFAREIEDAIRQQPSFSGSNSNTFFYGLLSGNEKETSSASEEFAGLMFRAEQLLESSYSVRTTTDLQAKKNEFYHFVSDHYENLKHSDMVRRLVTQSFMMHEYVDYHVAGAPATDIRKRYEAEVMDGVRNWLNILVPHIPQHEILNYCVSFYYDRSMVTLASKIIELFREKAYCPGAADIPDIFPDNLNLIGPGANNQKKLHEVNGSKKLAFVSDDCPVSMVETVVKARRAAQETEPTVIVVPLQKLNKHHLSMSRMVSGRNMLFVDDEKWRKENLPEKPKLPLFVQIEGEQVIDVAK